MIRKISVVVCTHNPRVEYLTRVIQGLGEQTLSRTEWDLLVVDNASEPPVAARFDLSWHPTARHVREEKLGLTPARLRGFAETRSELVVLVDDDNILDRRYLEEARRIARSWPMLGVWGGQPVPEFETPPAEWTKPYWWLIALGRRERDNWSNCWDGASIPGGAGMCVRREVADRYAATVAEDPLRAALDRRGNSLACAGDTDLAFTACDLGLGTAVFTSLEFTHLIPAGRLTETYLLNLREAMTCSQSIMQFTRKGNGSFRSGLRILTDYIRAWLSKGHDRRFRLASLRGEASARKLLKTLGSQGGASGYCR